MKSVYCKSEDQFKGNTGLKQVKEKLCKKNCAKKVREKLTLVNILKLSYIMNSYCSYLFNNTIAKINFF